jgi:prepilin-type N-terminal cleavage/methylation domain-containing protein
MRLQGNHVSVYTVGSSKRGLTLVELLIVLSIMAILIGTVALALTLWIGGGEETACLEDQRTLQSAVLAFHSQGQDWPCVDQPKVGGDPKDISWDIKQDKNGDTFVPVYVVERPGSDDKCHWQIDEQGLVVPAADATGCPCD